MAILTQITALWVAKRIITLAIKKNAIFSPKIIGSDQNIKPQKEKSRHFLTIGEGLDAYCKVVRNQFKNSHKTKTNKSAYDGQARLCLGQCPCLEKPGSHLQGKL
jgi:hypothetical protein